MSRFLRMIQARRRGEEGMALVLVIGSAMVLTLVASSALAYAVASQPLSRNSQDWNAALAAAQAGVDDYIRHLNTNDNYWQTVDCDNPAMLGPAVAGQCGQTTSSPVGWVHVNTAATDAEFHYDIASGGIKSDGTVTVTSTGKVNDVTRTLQVAVGRGGSTDFVYYTDYEQADPSNTNVYPSGAPDSPFCTGVDGSGQKVTNIYWWSGREDYENATDWRGRRVNPSCQEITFTSGDVLDGKVHLNDTPLMTGSPEFKEGLETSDPACKTATASNHDYFGCWRDDNRNDPIFDKPPSYADPLYLPDTSDQFKGINGSCQYSGQTRIRFTGDGNMLVWSPNSSATSACGGFHPAGVSVPIPNNNVIYVQAGGTVQQCGPGDIGDGLPVTYTLRHSGRNYTFVDANMREKDQYCGQGNLYVEGNVQGRVTLAASNSIVITGDLTLKNGLNGTDMIGLVAGNSVEVFHPVSDDCYRWTSRGACSQWEDDYQQINGYPDTAKGQGSNGGIQIYASIQTLNHSFYVQQYGVGSNQGTLWVYGSIAQRWRGIVGQTGSYGSQTGYLKSYNYDTRLKFSAPPYFPQWVNAVWSARHTGEIAPKYGGN